MGPPKNFLIFQGPLCKHEAMFVWEPYWLSSYNMYVYLSIRLFFHWAQKIAQKQNSKFRNEVILERFNCQKWEIKKKIK
jgi:hypothetical protein